MPGPLPGGARRVFIPLLNEQGGPLDNNLEQSLLYNMIELGREHPLAPDSAVPDAYPARACSARTNARCRQSSTRYAEKKPQQGMPLAITGLDESEFQTLRQWISEGAVIDATPALPGPQEQQQIDQWEAFFNRPALKNQLVSRYLYEHLFLAHLYFEELDTGNFFELVRSSTPPGKPVRIIPTLRPNDDPGQPFYYRLRKIESTIVHKTHIAYPLSETTNGPPQCAVSDADWELAQLPDYSASDALNPFATFSAIPARARYQFMLDSAQYIVMTFHPGSGVPRTGGHRCHR